MQNTYNPEIVAFIDRLAETGSNYRMEEMEELYTEDLGFLVLTLSASAHWIIVRQITLRQDLQDYLFIQRLRIKQRLGEGMEGLPSPPEDCRRPVECRFQSVMNTSG